MNEKILIIEDDGPQRKALREEFVKHGFTVLEAENGITGLELALHQHPDIILLDVRMPQMDGITMMHELRQDSWGKNASIIILTNYDTNDTQLFHITKDLPSYYLLKADTSMESILEKIQSILSDKKIKKTPLLS